MTPQKKIYNVLFLCTGNSARSIMAEAILNRVGSGRFRAFSAGAHPTGVVNPHTIDLLQRLGYETAGLRSKSWDEFTGADAPALDFVFTVCDNAAGESCPVWPGTPVTAHWGFEDPAAFQGPEAEKAIKFAEVFNQIERRIRVFVDLPMESLDKLSLQNRLDEIGSGLQVNSI
ncbi:MAG: arsenate reductase ArsC [Alphaproteobacteria bacterium]|nr:MAG: arsenate reductase ArsC [Alphaproteobacteria bacterium]